MSKKKTTNETLNESQDMIVDLGNFGEIQISHLTRMGSADEILAIGNQIRESKGLKPKKLDTFLRLSTTWEKIIKLHNVAVEEDGKKFFADNPKTLNDDLDTKSFSQICEKLLYTTLNDLPKDKGNLIKYSEALRTQQFDKILKIQNRGSFENRGTWFELVLLLDFATWLDIDLWYEVYSQFVSKELLVKRDIGGVSFKKLNDFINILPDRLGRSNKGCYVAIANLIRNTLFTPDEIETMKKIKKTKGKSKMNIWNSPLCSAETHEIRSNIEDQLISFMDNGLVTSYPQLKQVTLKLLSKL